MPSHTLLGVKYARKLSHTTWDQLGSLLCCATTKPSLGRTVLKEGPCTSLLCTIRKCRKADRVEIQLAVYLSKIYFIDNIE